jgi:hypothetical protein
MMFSTRYPLNFLNCVSNESNLFGGREAADLELYWK